MSNPFDLLDARLSAIESLLIEIKQHKGDTPTTPGQPQSPYVTKRQAAALLACSPGTIDNHARAGILARHYVGQSVRFARAEVLALARTHKGHSKKATAHTDERRRA